LTGAAQTSFVLKYFNNASGGGGNDWALDDISVSTCSPNMNYSPSLNPNVCDSNILTIHDTVRCFFNNYVYYKWQRSTDGGTIWTDVTAALGPAVPVWNGSAWQYVTSYTIPPSQTQPINNGDKYRLVVATTIANLSDAACRFTDVMNIITIQVIVCGIPMHTQLKSFDGDMKEQEAHLNWATTNELESVIFDIEKSLNGTDFFLIGTVNGQADSSSNYYSFADPLSYTGPTFYRIRMHNDINRSIYSRIIQLASSTNELSFLSVINPFDSRLEFTVTSPSRGMIQPVLIDQNGIAVLKNEFSVSTGVNKIALTVPPGLPTGLYYLRVIMNGNIIQRRVWRKN
jgi:hypothetical protein